MPLDRRTHLTVEDLGSVYFIENGTFYMVAVTHYGTTLWGNPVAVDLDRVDESLALRLREIEYALRSLA